MYWGLPCTHPSQGHGSLKAASLPDSWVTKHIRRGWAVSIQTNTTKPKAIPPVGSDSGQPKQLGGPGTAPLLQK